MVGAYLAKIARFLCFKLFSIERPKLLGMAPNVGKNALTFFVLPFFLLRPKDKGLAGFCPRAQKWSPSDA